MKIEQDNAQLEHYQAKIVSQFIIKILPLSSEQEIISCLADTLSKGFEVQEFAYYAYAHDGNFLTRVDIFSDKNSVPLKQTVDQNISLGDGLVGMVAESIQYCYLEDLSQKPELAFKQTDHLSAIAIPLVADTELIGVIYCGNKKCHGFPLQIQKSLSEVASITAIKMEKNRAMEQLQHTIEKLEYSSKIQDSLFEIAELIFATSNMDEFYQRLHKSIGKLMFAANFFVALEIEDGQAVTLPYAVDEVDEVPPNEVIPIDKNKPSITGFVLSSNKPLRANKQKMQSMIDDNQLYIKGSLPEAWLGVPFGEPPLHGVVVVQSYTQGLGFSEKDEQLLCFVARHIRNAIERMQAKSDLQFLALHDPLTKLANRTLFNDRVTHALNKCKREPNRKIALLFLDLDKFKQVNDTYGHHIGDLLLIEVAAVLHNSIRETDSLSRLGGDEFAILLEDIDSVESAQVVANKIIKSLQSPFVLEKIQIKTSTSIGIAFHNQSENSIESVITCADEAMYQAKQLGRNRAVVHQSDMQTLRVATNVIEQDTVEGLLQNQFFFVFQPIVNLVTGEIVAAEALVRWNNSKRGVLPPKAFLHEMEQNSSILQLDVYNVVNALKHIAAWRSVLSDGFRLSVNISAQSFASITLLEAVQAQFEKDPGLFQYLSFETTEESIVRGVEITRAQMNIFSKMGIELALDDFGTGYSSLSYLGQFKFDYIKIDRSFISENYVTSEQSVILESISSLAKSLAIQTVAEGIENQKQLGLMQHLKCSMGQGFYISKPLSEEEFLELLASKGSFLLPAPSRH
jgi:diguanylate cyclase (GGDEF)-like protein